MGNTNPPVTAAEFWLRCNIVRHGHFVCWEWSRGCTWDGYGEVKFEGKMWRVPRLAWTLNYGPIPKEIWVLHKCDNPKCFRPTHLWLGTHKANMADAVRKGRMASGEHHGLRKHPECVPKGDAHYKSKVTVKMALCIKHLRDQGLTQTDIANKVGVSQRTISRVLLKRTWISRETFA